MTYAITPNRARVLLKNLREARSVMTYAALEFLAARAAERAASRAVAAMPQLDYRVGHALARGPGVIGSVNRAWRDRIGATEARVLADAGQRVEDALGAVSEARFWYREARRAVRAIDSGAQPVEVGAAWSSRGLANVRAARR